MEIINKNFFQWLLVIIFLFFFVFYFFNKQNVWIYDLQMKDSNISEYQYIKIAGKTIKAEVASTLEQKEKGLSGRKELKEEEGMLFIFDYPDKYSFWMKDMNFPLDIIWIKENFEIIYIKKDVRPESYPETFLPPKEAKYVLEVISHFSDKNNLKEGDKVEFLP